MASVDEASEPQLTNNTIKSNKSSNSTKMLTCPNDAACNKPVGFRDHKEREKHEKEFFSLFDFAAESTSTETDTVGASLKTIQGAASAVFGGIWSAFDTAIAILNEDMNMEEPAEGIFPRPTDEEANDCDSLMDMMSESIENGAVEDYVESKQSPSNVKSSSIIKDESTGNEAESMRVDDQPLESNVNLKENPKHVPEHPVVSRSTSVSIFGKCLSVSSNFVADTHEHRKIAPFKDDNPESEYCIIHNESCKSETNDGWLVVSDD